MPVSKNNEHVAFSSEKAYYGWKKAEIADLN